MANLKRASDDIKKFSAMFAGLVELGNEIDKIDSLENHCKELEAQKAELAENVNKLHEIQDQELAKKASIERQNLDLIAAAKSQAEKIGVEAKAKAKQIVDSAESKAFLYENKIKVEKDEFSARYKDAENALASLNSEVLSAQARLDAINLQIKKIKEL